MKQCDIFVGRFQPFHNGHLAAHDKMQNHRVVVVVQGAKSSKKENPLPVEKQVNMIGKVVGKETTVIVSTHGYIPDIITRLRDEYDLNPHTIVCGPDRMKTYKAQIHRANAKLDDPLIVEFKEAERITSGSAVREAIRSGDRKAYKANVPEQLWDEFTNLAEHMRGATK